MPYIESYQLVETYTYTIDQPGGGTITWDIRKAKEIVDYYPPVIVAIVDIPLEEMARIAAQQTHLSETLIEHADMSIPGIGAPLVWEEKIFYILIDGNTRCVKALRKGIAFKARLLSDEASRECIIRCTNWNLIPQGDVT